MSKSLQFDFSLLPHWVQSRLLILDFNVLDANWTRSIYLRQRQQLIQTYLEEVSSTSSSHSSFFSPTTVDKYNKNELNESNEVHDIKTLNTQNGSWKHSTHASFSLEDRNETSSELDSSFVVLPDSSSEITIKLKKKNPVLEPSLNPSSTPLLTSHSPMLSTSSSTFDGLKNTPKTELTLFTTPSLNAPHHSNKNTSPSSYSELPTNSQIHTRPLNSKPSTTPTENAEPVSCMPATSKINRSENIIMSSDFIDEEVSSLPKDYLWSRLCKLVTSRPSSPYIKVLNSHGSLVQTISVNTFIEHVKRIAWYLLTEQKKNMQPDQPPSTESTSQLPFTFHTFLIVSSNATVHLECMVAGWLAGIPCAPMYLYQVKTKLDATRVLETLQPRWVVLDSSSSHMTSSFQNWIPKKFNLRVYQELLSSLENEKHINLDTPRIEDPPPIFYIDTHWHPSRHSHLRTIAVSVDTVHRHCRWLKPYMGSVFLQPYKLSGASHLVSLASLCHGSTLIIINDRISHFSIDQWFVLLHTYHVQSTWLRSITSRQWHSASSSSSSSTSTSSGSSSSITSSHPTPTEHLLLEDPTSPQIHFLKPYAENVVGFTCCDTLSGIWIGLGEVIPNVSTTNPSWLTAYPSLVWIPSLIRLPLGDTKPSVQSPLLYLPNPHASHGYYLIHHRENDVLYLMNLGSSEDLWHSVPETRRFPLLYCSWFYQMFPGLSHFSFFLVSRLPWLVYSGSIHSSLLETFLATLDMSAVVLQVRRLDKLDLLWTLVEVKMFRWCSNGKKTIPPCLPTPSFTQASVSKPLTTSLIYSCLFEYLIHHAENMPDQVAYMDSTQEITWSVLSQRVSLAAMYLFKKGLSPGDTVIISYIHSIDYIIVLHACLYSGILVIPLAPPDLARLTEEVPRWISVILEFGIQTILAGNGVIGTFVKRVVFFFFFFNRICLQLVATVPLFLFCRLYFKLF
ncbi:hypothetical protein HMI56_006836 [Coelomomyces lativittatus]|nr:hypothetical protein HMI56_006836 [Coelomomyces lativittatus]